MNAHKQNTIAYAVGFLEDFVESNTNPIEIAEEDKNDDSYIEHVQGENEHREQIKAMMKVVSEGFTQLSREVTALRNNIFLAEAALKTPFN